MKIKYLALSTAVAMLLGAASRVHAAGITVSNAELILGFQDGSNSITFDVGNVSPVLTALNGVTTDLGINLNTALSYTGGGSTTLGSATGYGSTWNSSGSVVWGAAGKDTSGNYRFWTGMAATPSASIATGPAVATATLHATASAATSGGSLGTLVFAMGTAPKASLLTAGGSTVLGIKYGNTSGNSFHAIDPNSSASAFSATITPSVALNANAGTGLTTGSGGLLNGLNFSALDLYQFQDVSGITQTTFLGTLELATTGELFFTAATAIPEPSTYAAIFGVLALGFVMIRRRQQALV